MMKTESIICHLPGGILQNFISTKFPSMNICFSSRIDSNLTESDNSALAKEVIAA
jgi:hypothetical protein